MAVAFHSDSIEIQEEDDDDDGDNQTPQDDVQYENVETKTSSQKLPRKKSGRCKLIGLVVGLLCGVQALLNIGLRLSLHSEPINNLTKHLDHLQSSYDNVTKHLDQMTKQKDDLQSRYDNVTAERDELKRRLCGGWQTFGSSFYYISTEKKTWEASRQWCRDRGADLVIINSKEEQDFVNRVVNGNAWLGLTDSEQEGVWKWVNGTPVTSTPTYWSPNYGVQPNGGVGSDCAVHHSGDGWYDYPCTETRPWMCEKVV